MCVGNVGGKSVQLLMEFVSNIYILKVMWLYLFMLKIIVVVSVYIGFVNDVYLYYKESL